MNQTIHEPARPVYFQAVDHRREAQTEMSSQITLRAETAAAANFLYNPAVSNLNGYAGPDRTAVRFLPYELNCQRMIRGARGVVQKARRIVHVIDDDIDSTGVEEIAECDAT